MNKYSQALLEYSSKMDSITGSYGEITRVVTELINYNEDKTTLVLLNKISDIIDSNKNSVSIKKAGNKLKDSLIQYLGYLRIKEICDLNKSHDEDPRTLPELLNELNNLIGLEKVKSKVDDLICFQEIQMLRSKIGFKASFNTLHLAFTGNPGTGKTTVARIIGRLYKQIGLLSRGHFIEASRTDLIAGYQGQTALKVKKIVEKAKGGVLFIDEAYSITENDHSDSYGRECLTELTKALEDYREDLVVIVAGYTEPMSKFFESNPGLKSRFNTFIEFGDYDSHELNDILNEICKQNDYLLSDAVNIKIYRYLEQKVANKDSNFANGRLVRNIFDDLVMNHARRVSNMENRTRDDLITFQDVDFMI